MPPARAWSPGLAESWEISEDELVYTFALREDAKFSNGEPVTVEDVVFSYQKAARPDGHTPSCSSRWRPLRRWTTGRSASR